MKVCGQRGCPRLTNESHCLEHKRIDKRPNATERGYGDRAWQQLAAQVRAEEPNCRRCGEPTEVAGHIVAIRHGGARLERSNVMGLCRSCNGLQAVEDERKLGPRGKN